MAKTETSSLATDLATPTRLEQAMPRDPFTEAQLKAFGWPFELKTIPLDAVTKAVDAERFQQRPGEKGLDQEWLFGIQDNMHRGIPVPPIVAAEIKGQRGLVVPNGHHRTHSARQLNWPEIRAYVVKVPTAADAHLLARSLNVSLNGQGLSEQQRRQAAIDHLVFEAGNLNAITKSQINIAARLFSLRPKRIREFIDVQLIQERLRQLRLPVQHEQTKSSSGVGIRPRHGDSWFLAIGGLLDEELTAFWDVLCNSTPKQVQDASAELRAQRTASSRAAKAAELFALMAPKDVATARKLSAEDQQRKLIAQVNIHAKSLIRLGKDKLSQAGNMSQETLTVLADLSVLLGEMFDDARPTHTRQHEVLQ